MRFTKMHGCGNDYVYIDCLAQKVENAPELARAVSDRHFGIGSDGLILICPSDVADFCMEMYNADGSEGQMCGNGIRCVAKYVYDHEMTRKTEITVETKAGIRSLALTVEGGRVTLVKVDMGTPILEPSRIPILSDKKRIVDEPVMVGGQEYRITGISMGNPHAVVFVEDTAVLDLEELGPLFENHPLFPERINTEFVQVLNQNEINMRVWERGSGETLACGTGTCAAAVACVLNGRTQGHLTVHLSGGDLLIDYDGDTVWMTGPAVTVFEGDMDDV